MRNFLSFAVIVLLFYSCKKEAQNNGNTQTNTNTGNKKYAVNFTIDNAELNTNAIKSSKVLNGNSTIAISKVLNYLSYFVYDASGNLVHDIFQDTTTTTLGNITDSFNPGTYTIVLVGSMHPLSIASSNIFPLSSYSTLSNAVIYQPSIKDDFFYKKMSITVSNSNITQNVTLDRIAAKLEIKMLDAIPADVSEIQVTWTTEYSNFSFATDSLVTPSSGAAYFNPAAADVGKTNEIISSLEYNTYTPITVVITPISSTLIRPPVTINNVTCVRNEITILSGNVFGNSSSKPNQGFTVTLDPDWGSVTTGTFNQNSNHSHEK